MQRVPDRPQLAKFVETSRGHSFRMRRKCQLRVSVDPKTRDSWRRSDAMSIQYNVSVHDLLELLTCSNPDDLGLVSIEF